MNETGSSNPLSATRRDFLKTGTAIVGGSLVGQLGLSSIAHAAGSGVIKIGLVGCGGRGTGAASQALAAGKDIHLVAMGDAFSDRLEQSLHSLKGLTHDSGGNARIDVPPERRFVGIDAYKHVIEAVRRRAAVHAAPFPAGSIEGGHRGGQARLCGKTGGCRRTAACAR